MVRGNFFCKRIDFEVISNFKLVWNIDVQSRLIDICIQVLQVSCIHMAKSVKDTTTSRNVHAKNEQNKTNSFKCFDDSIVKSEIT